MLKVLMIVVKAFATNCYIVFDQYTRKAVIIDSGGDVEKIAEIVGRRRLNPVSILATHGHFDHIAGVEQLRRSMGLEFLMSRRDTWVAEESYRLARAWGFSLVGNPPRPDGDLWDLNSINLGDSILRIEKTPGHTPGHTIFYDPEKKRIFTGDLLLAGGVGRSDLPGGDYSLLKKSLRKIAETMPPQTKIFPGHGPLTTLRHEKQWNISLKTIIAS